MQIVVAAFFQFIFKMHQAEQNVHSAFDFLPPTPKNGGIFCFIFYHFSLIRLSEDKRKKKLVISGFKSVRREQKARLF